MSPRTRVRALDIRRNERVDSGASEEQTLKGRYFEADCLATDAIGHFVRITGAEVMGVAQVTKVDVTVSGQYPACGVIVEKPTSTRCLVVTHGEITVSPATLTPGKVYWIGLDAKLSAALPTPAPLGIAAAQAVGSAIAAGRFLVNPNMMPIIRRG